MKNEYVIEGMQKKDDIDKLLEFAKSVSGNCHKLTVQFLGIIKNHKQVVRETVYQDLLRRNFVYKKQITSSGVCAKILEVRSFAFRCLQCQNQDNSIICIECFNKSDHRGHHYRKIQVHGGCCDCGDDEKWKAQGSCTDHNQKITDVPIDSSETELFIKQLQYFLYLAFAFTFFPIIEYHKQHINQMLIAFAKFLTKFNEQSVISNEMTFLLFKSQFEDQPRVKHKQSYYHLKISVLSYLFRFYNEAQFSRIIIDLFITMFTRFSFRKFLTIQYNKAVGKKPLILKSQLSNISCQIYTSHRVISQVIETKQFNPICVAKISGENFESISNIYSRFYLDLVYLSNLYNQVGEKYMNYHFMEGNVCNLSGYELYARNDPEISIQYYGIEYILFCRSTELFKYMSANPQVLVKAIRDLVTYLKQQSNTMDMSLFISKQRTLILLLFIYFQGDIQKATTLAFLEQIGLTYISIYRMLQAVLHVIRFYAVNLANRQTVDRFYTFYSFCLNKKPRIIPSLDFQLLKFCLLSLLHFLNEPNFDMDIEGNQCFYEKIETFQENAMHLPDLLALPMWHVSNVLSSKINVSEEGAYDRRKAFGVFTDYIGLLHEAIITNNSELCLKVTYRFDKSGELEKELMQFYGSLLKNLECIKLEEFKDICKIFLYEEEIVLEKFVRECCAVENKKIKLKNQKVDEFESFNLSYLKSKKCCEPLIPYFTENQKKNPVTRMPVNIKNKFIINNLKGLIFNKKLIQGIKTNTRLYLQIFGKYPEIIEKDLPHFSQFIKELVKLNCTLQNQQIIKVLQLVRNCIQIFKQIPEPIQKDIVGSIGVGGFTNEMQNEKDSSKQSKQLKKSKMSELKARKLQKMKQKQLKTLQTFVGQKNGEMINENDELRTFCMFCKIETQQPLSILCFGQKSKIFAKSYLGCNRAIKMLTTCNHFVHKSCNKAINNKREYIHCNFCKTSSNQLLEINEESQLIENQMSQSPNSQSASDKIEMISSSILYGIFADYQFFTRSLSKVCCYLLRSLGGSRINIDSLIQSIDEDQKQSQITQGTSLCWNAFKFTILSTASMLALQRQNKTPTWDIRILQQQLPQELVEKISLILSSIRAMKFMKNLDEITVAPYNPLSIRKLPTQLKDLQHEIGNCPNCSRVTNEIAICLLCTFKSCVGCSKKNLTNHASEEHGDATIFVRVDEGWLIYVSTIKNRMMDSVYLNFMGEHFALQKGERKLTREGYNLDMTAYNRAKNDLIRHRVEQEIRYGELNTSKISDINP